MSPDVKGKQGNEDNEDNDIEVVEVGAEFIEVGPDERTEVGQNETPGERAKKCIEAKFAEGHSCDTGGKRDVGTHDRQ